MFLSKQFDRMRKGFLLEAEQLGSHGVAHCEGEEGRDGVTDLPDGVTSVAFEGPPVGEGLHSRAFSRGDFPGGYGVNMSFSSALIASDYDCVAGLTEVQFVDSREMIALSGAHSIIARYDSFAMLSSRVVGGPCSVGFPKVS